MAKTKKLSEIEMIFYYLFVIVTFGMLWVYKIVVKKAISEMNEQD